MDRVCLEEGSRLRRTRAGPRAAALVPAFWIAMAMGAPEAGAIDKRLCSQDGMTEIPEFADGRDSNGCLMIDPGNGDAPIPFQYETFHRHGISETSKTSGEKFPGVDIIDMRAERFGKCSTKDKGDYCTFVVWDVTIDNYLSQDAEGNDTFFLSGNGVQHFYIKDTKFLNNWRCSGGSGWNGPNGLRCRPGESNSSHTDGIQARLMPLKGGWFVMQDSAIMGSGKQTMIIQGNNSNPGNYMFQGVEFRQPTTPAGASNNWRADCLKRGRKDTVCDGSGNPIQIDKTIPEVWVIDTFGDMPFSNWDAHEKVVLINTGCDKNGCNGNTGYSNGWPHPLLSRSTGGPDTCPNGLIKEPLAAGVKSVFCYTSLEEALNDQVTSGNGEGSCPAQYCPHKAPPFVHLTSTGWENAPDGAPAPRPAAPTLLP